jgi:hypothetical protein
LFSFFLSFHPAFFDRTNPLFQSGTLRTAWWIWIFPIFISLFLANISAEFLHYGRLLTKRELRAYVAKSWAVTLLFSSFSMGFMRLVGMSSVGSHLFLLLGGLVRFVINTSRVKFFGHREYLPRGDTRDSSKS